MAIAVFVSSALFVSSSDIRPIYYHITWDATMYNTLVGKAGGSTGTQRGYITSTYVMPSYVTNGHRFIRAEYCAKDGDSGAAVFNTNTAYGIHSGGAQIAGGCRQHLLALNLVRHDRSRLVVAGQSGRPPVPCGGRGAPGAVSGAEWPEPESARAAEH